jgi:hypothetical protein
VNKYIDKLLTKEEKELLKKISNLPEACIERIVRDYQIMLSAFL